MSERDKLAAEMAEMSARMGEMQAKLQRLEAEEDAPQPVLSPEEAAARAAAAPARRYGTTSIDREVPDASSEPILTPEQAAAAAAETVPRTYGTTSIERHVAPEPKDVELELVNAGMEAGPRTRKIVDNFLALRAKAMTAYSKGQYAKAHAVGQRALHIRPADNALQQVVDDCRVRRGRMSRAFMGLLASPRTRTLAIVGTIVGSILFVLYSLQVTGRFDGEGDSRFDSKVKDAKRALTIGQKASKHLGNIRKGK